MSIDDLPEQEIYAALPRVLLPWYNAIKRALPWRGTKNPYHIWLSEIMLQQTRVEAVKGYYSRFLTSLPTISSLAKAEDELLHKLWEGLGYYSRVRNLKKAANVIMTQYGGIFPGEYDKILALPGVGEYTAGAVGSIAFNLPTPAVDGNVLRVIARLTGDDTPIDLSSYKKSVQEKLRRVYPEQAGDFTQALMELGATVCGPNRKPDCSNCPCGAFCKALKDGTQLNFPVRTPKAPRKTQELTVFIFRCGDSFALCKRPRNGLLAGLWQFPNLPGKLDAHGALQEAERLGLHPKELIFQLERSHIFTHITWQMQGFYLSVQEMSGDFTWLTAKEINTQAALPTAFRQFWQEIKNI